MIPKLRSTAVSGFTLTELMVTVGIVAILAAVAYPSYTSHIRKARRTEAKAALLQIQVAQEKYFLQNNTYTTIANLGLGSTGTYYTISISPTSPSTSYTATATVTGTQTADTNCNTFSINETGAKASKNSSNVATTDCW